MSTERTEKISLEEQMRHSFAHVLAQAVLRIYPETKLGIGPAIKDGFYYDFDLTQKLTPSDLPKIEKEIQAILADKIPFTQIILNRNKAVDLLHQQGQLYKTELLNEIPDEKVSFYKTGDEFIDMCRGPHVKHTGELGAFKLMSVAGAYWRGDEKRPQMQRIYGIAFRTESQLEQHLKNLSEMKKRDHRKLGKKFELFLIDENVGQGLVMWLPNGAQIRKKIEDFEYNERLKLGYKPVYTPHIGNIKLFKESGHWQHYRDSMYSPLEIDKEKYLLKPMNCPYHAKIYARKTRSYRDLPIKYAEYGTVYRYEKSGELSGLTRVRGFTQDDAHIFFREDQTIKMVQETLKATINLITAFGFDNYQMRLSLWDPADKGKYINKPQLWKKAEKQLRAVLDKLNTNYVEAPGEAAFYGPKVDFLVQDALGRQEQCGTVQLDFNLPEKFNLCYIDDKGKKQRPVMIHWAPLGSFERWFSRLIEHYGAAFPVWLCPSQTIIIPISNKFIDYARSIKDKLDKYDISTEVDERDETLQAKIRDAEIKKIPYMLIIGKKEETSKTISVRSRNESDLGMMKFEEFLARIQEEIASKK